MWCHILGPQWDGATWGQCSITHMEAGMGRHLQNRTNRLHLRNRVMNLASELRIMAYSRASRTEEKENGQTGVRRDAIKAPAHDMADANHARDYRFWAMCNGCDVTQNEVRNPILEIHTNGATTRVYDYRKSGEEREESKTIYLISHRGHMRFAKQCRRTADGRGVRW